MKASRVGMVGAVIMSLSSLSKAEEVQAFHPTGLVDMYAGSMVDLSVDFATGDDFTGILPQLAGQFGNGSLAVGVRAGLAVGILDYSDDTRTGWVPQNIGLDLKGKHCLQDTRFCLGFNLGVGVAFSEDTGDKEGYFAGVVDNQLRYSRYLFDAVIFEPLATVSYQDGLFFLQLALGPSFGISTSDNEGREIDPALLFEVQAGVRIQDFMAVGLGFKGQHIFIEEESSFIDYDEFKNQYSLDMSARFFLGKLSPVVRLSVPLEGIFKHAMDVSVMVGALYEF